MSFNMRDDLPPAKRHKGGGQKGGGKKGGPPAGPPALTDDQIKQVVAIIRDSEGGVASCSVIGGTLHIKQKVLSNPSLPWTIREMPGKDKCQSTCAVLKPGAESLAEGMKSALQLDPAKKKPKPAKTETQPETATVEKAPPSKKSSGGAGLVVGGLLVGNSFVPECIAGGISDQLKQHPKCLINHIQQAHLITGLEIEHSNSEDGTTKKCLASTTIKASGQRISGVGGGLTVKKDVEAVACDDLLKQLLAAGLPIGDIAAATSPAGRSGSVGGVAVDRGSPGAPQDRLFIGLLPSVRESLDNVFEQLTAAGYMEQYSRPTLAPAIHPRQGMQSQREGMENNIAPDMGRQAESGRATLPIAKHEQQIIQIVEQNQVVLLSGATGSGKTTQVPQYLLDYFSQNGSGESVQIGVSQPRRISAISAAQRVAWERGEEVGRSVGHSVRMDASRPTCRHSVLYMTAGILLRRLAMAKGGDIGFTHVILDEIHERSLDSDFLLVIFRELLKNNCRIKLILMSATLQVERFKTYFGGCPVIDVEGKMFPVQEKYLEDVVSICGVPRGPPEEEGSTDEAARLTCALVQKIITDPPILPKQRGMDGVLVFLPGWQEILRVKEALDGIAPSLSRTILVLPLHSTLSKQEQQSVFDRPPDGVLKIVLSTNIAETSLTIDDILYVIDSGRVKEKSYIPHRKLTTFGPAWISKSSAQQRKGRAGRVQPGVVFRLFSKSLFAAFDDHPVPEMQRVAMHQTILHILQSGLAQDPKAFLAQTLDAPSSATVDEAITDLRRMECIVGQHTQYGGVIRLTMLGFRIAKLPGVDPPLGRALILSCFLGVADPVLTVVASMQLGKPPFLSMKNGQRCRTEAIAAKQRLTEDSPGSDDLAVVAAFEGWQQAENKMAFCRDNCLDPIGMKALKDLRSLIWSDLMKDFDRSQRDGGNPGEAENQLASRSNMAQERDVVKAVIVAGLYPNFATASAKGKRAFFIKGEGVCLVHSDSTNSRSDITTSTRNPICMYHEKTRVDSEPGPSNPGGRPITYLSDTTLTAPMPLLLFSYDDFRVQPVQSEPPLDTPLVKLWIPAVGQEIQFSAQMDDAARLEVLRRALMSLLRRFTANPMEPLDQLEQGILASYCFLLSSNLQQVMHGDSNDASAPPDGQEVPQDQVASEDVDRQVLGIYQATWDANIDEFGVAGVCQALGIDVEEHAATIALVSTREEFTEAFLGCV